MFISPNSSRTSPIAIKIVIVFTLNSKLYHPALPPICTLTPRLRFFANVTSMDKYPRRSLEDVRAERRAVSNSTVTFSTPTKPRFVNKWSSKPMNNLKPYITKATQKPESQEEKEWFRRNENSLTPIQIPQVTTSSKEPHTSLDSNNLSAELRSFSYAIQELKDQVLSLKQAMDEQSEQVLSHRKQLWAMRKKLDGTWQADEDFVKSRQ